MAKHRHRAALLVRFPAGLYDRLKQMALADGTSATQFIVMACAEKMAREWPKEWAAPEHNKRVRAILGIAPRVDGGIGEPSPGIAEDPAPSEAEIAKE